ncbi:MAG: sodium:solute symporter [Verrucomicrobia bacterium]|nr:MAG: sodium:solute symporter [Verrucomicrobiota bacterium]
MHLAPIDWLIILVYLTGCMGAGIWMRRYVRGVEDFAVAGRAMDLNLGIASLAATELGLVTVMYTAQLGFTKGFAGAIIGVLMALAMYLVGRTGFVIGPLRRAGVMTIPELFEKRFGIRVRWLAGLFVVFGGLLNMGIFLRLGGEFIVAATGIPTHWLEWVMTALLGLVLVYTALGGMLSVLVTDYLQFLVKGMGIVVTSILVIASIGWSGLLHGLTNAWSSSQAGNALPGLKMAGHPFNPVYSGWGYVLWQVIFQIAVVTTWQTQISRVLSARDETIARRMYRRTAFYFVGRFGLPGLWGAAALVYWTQHGGLPPELQGLPADTASLRATPAYLGILLPTGFIGLLLAAALAAEMSTDSGYLLTWATVIYNDLITPCIKRPLSGATRLLITRCLVMGIGVFLLFFGLWYQLRGNAWDYLAVTGNIYLASVFTLLVAGLYWPRATAQGAYAALVLGAIGPITFLVVNSHKPAGAPDPISPQASGAASFALAFLGMIVGSLASKRVEGRGSREAEMSVQSRS